MIDTPREQEELFQALQDFRRRSLDESVRAVTTYPPLVAAEISEATLEGPRIVPPMVKRKPRLAPRYTHCCHASDDLPATIGVDFTGYYDGSPATFSFTLGLQDFCPFDFPGDPCPDPYDAPGGRCRWGYRTVTSVECEEGGVFALTISYRLLGDGPTSSWSLSLSNGSDWTAGGSWSRSNPPDGSCSPLNPFGLSDLDTSVAFSMLVGASNICLNAADGSSADALVYL